MSFRKLEGHNAVLEILKQGLLAEINSKRCKYHDLQHLLIVSTQLNWTTVMNAIFQVQP